MTWQPKGVQRLLFRRSSTGWHWTRRAEFIYAALARA